MQTTDLAILRQAWKDMHARCNTATHKAYKHYGARGIHVSPAWQTLEGFLQDMQGSWFPGATLDRQDVNSGYDKQNCRWIVRADQTTVGRLRRRYNNRTGITGVEYTRGSWRVIVRERGKPRGQGAKYTLYSGRDFFEACCRRRAWETQEAQIPASSLR